MVTILTFASLLYTAENARDHAGFNCTTWHAYAYTFFEEKKSFMKMDALFVENLILSDDNTW